MSIEFPVIFLNHTGIRRCKEDLENQIAQNRVRAEKEREEKDMEKRELRQMVAEHAAYQEALKAEEKKKLLVRILISIVEVGDVGAVTCRWRNF